MIIVGPLEKSLYSKARCLSLILNIAFYFYNEMNNLGVIFDFLNIVFGDPTITLECILHSIKLLQQFRSFFLMADPLCMAALGFDPQCFSVQP